MEYIYAGLVKRSLANTPQIAFEFIDACNLNCAYYGFRESLKYLPRCSIGNKIHHINLKKRYFFI